MAQTNFFSLRFYIYLSRKNYFLLHNDAHLSLILTLVYIPDRMYLADNQTLVGQFDF